MTSTERDTIFTAAVVVNLCSLIIAHTAALVVVKVLLVVATNIAQFGCHFNIAAVQILEGQCEANERQCTANHKPKQSPSESFDGACKDGNADNEASNKPT